jgi:Asp-tRNA(Asn)/Glu-tRNA(Gln) amidotransferase A subunit family amidase
MNLQDPENFTIAGVAPDVQSRKISPVELTRLFLARIERLNPVLNAYVTITAENALAQAQRAEDEIAQGNYRGALHGIPFSIKDNIATHGVRTTAGSKVLENWILTSTLPSSPS